MIGLVPVTYVVAQPPALVLEALSFSNRRSRQWNQVGDRDKPGHDKG